MASMRGDAAKSYDGKLDRMGLGISTASTGAKAEGHVYPQDDGSQGRAQGGRAKGYATAADNEATLADKAPKKLRLDRPGYKHGGAVKKGTTVNVIVAPQGGPEAAPPMAPPDMPMPPPKPPMAPPPGAGAMPPPGGGGGMPGMGAPPPMMRANGGRVQNPIKDRLDASMKETITPVKPDMEGLKKMIGRKDGGRVKYDAGAGSGLGRLEKIKNYGGK